MSKGRKALLATSTSLFKKKKKEENGNQGKWQSLEELDRPEETTADAGNIGTEGKSSLPPPSPAPEDGRWHLSTCWHISGR